MIRVFLFGALITFLLLARDVRSQTLTERLGTEDLTTLAADAIRFGDPVRGAMAFYTPSMNCARCHEAVNQRRLGPDLAEQRDVTAEHLVASVLSPSQTIRTGYETALVQLIDGTSIQGVLVRETEDELTIDQIERLEKPLIVALADVEDWKRTKISTMPDGLANQLTDRRQFLDLIAYLIEIARLGPDRAKSLKPAGALATKPLPEYESRIDHMGLISDLDDVALERGKAIYRLRCATCHGTKSEEGSMPTSLRFAKGMFKNGSDPYRMYQTLTHGFGMMNPQRWMVPQQKYDVIHYLREHFLRSSNPSQYVTVTEAYLNSLPVGNTKGPKPVDDRPWTRMDYGPSLINTIEVSRDGSNIAQKGIAIRLDEGPGGVESGSHWMMYDHDTMRLAGAWTGNFINYEGIHFNGVHGRHPKIAGNIQWSNSTGPGWASPEGSFEDDRLVGRDGKRYGPLDRKWLHYKGMYRYGRQTIVEYTVDSTRVLESPGLLFLDERPVYLRKLNLAARDQALTVQIAELNDARFTNVEGTENTVMLSLANQRRTTNSKTDEIALNGTSFAEIKNGDEFDLTHQDFTICGRVRCNDDGTIIAQTTKGEQWQPDGKTLFIRNGRLAYDIGWVGAAQSKKRIDDGKWHNFAMTWRSSDGLTRFFVDGKRSGKPQNLKPKKDRPEQVIRIGFTNDDFPDPSFLEGALQNLQFYQRLLSEDEILDPAKRDLEGLIAWWNQTEGEKVVDKSKHGFDAVWTRGPDSKSTNQGLVADFSADVEGSQWIFEDGCLRLRIPPGPAMQLSIAHSPIENQPQNELLRRIHEENQLQDLSHLLNGGPANWPQELITESVTSQDSGPFAVDVLTRPVDNPWNCQLRLTGIDFLPDGDSLVASSWDGSVWMVKGISESGSGKSIAWRRIAAGLFQPLGIKWIDGKIFVTCRDQLAVLHDLNEDGEMDWYQSLNNDHQVTEHFHEFAMGLQTDSEGNFYYAKSARHALPAVVPHHGTLLKVSADGVKTEILANGFRAANGVCLNPDGSFLVTDQEGHWNPKNRINWVQPGGFYGNMYGYHDVTDDSDEVMEDPLCWITNSFDRSPSELLWVDSPDWGPLSGALLNFSYGYGKIYVVLHEEMGEQMQGGMCELPLEQFPTGVMRGRFHPKDGQLYCCGMFAWAGNQQQPGGLYRVRYVGGSTDLPVALRARTFGLELEFTDSLEKDSVVDPRNFAITSWDLKRTKNYGSDHYNERRLKVEKSKLSKDGKTIRLTIPEIQPTWGMEIQYSLRSIDGRPVKGVIHNTIHRLADEP